MRKILRIFCFSWVFAVVSWVAHGQVNEHEKDLIELANTEMKAWVYNDIVIEALRRQNAKHADLSLTDKKVLDRRWQQEKRKANSPLIKKLTNNPVAEYLQKIKEESDGLYTEIIIVDDQGLNLAQTDISGSYWQGEEKKWENTFKSRSYAAYVSDVRFDDTVQMFQAEVAFMIISEDQPIGIVYAGIDVEKLDER